MRLKLIFVLLLSCHLASAVESACTNEPDGVSIVTMKRDVKFNQNISTDIPG